MGRCPSLAVLSAIGLCLTACVSADVQQEVALIDGASSDVSTRTIAAIQPQIDAFEAQAPERAAANRDLWTLSEGCSKAQEIYNYDALQTCRVVKVANATTGSDPTQIQAIERKLATLTEYTGLLSELASAETEAEIKLAYGALSDALASLGAATGSSGIGDISEVLTEKRDKVDALVDASVSALRARYLRRTVRAAHPALVAVSAELKAAMRAIDFDPAYGVALDAMRAAEIEALDASASDDEARMAAAFRNLEAQHAAFIEVAEASVYIQLDQLVAAHGGLRARLAARPSAAQLAAYVGALKDLKATLEG